MVTEVSFRASVSWLPHHGILTEGKGSVQLNSMYWLVQISCFWYLENVFFYKTSYLNEEVNHTEYSPLVRVPWPRVLSGVELSPSFLSIMSTVRPYTGPPLSSISDEASAERLKRDWHTSLFVKRVNYIQNSFVTLVPASAPWPFCFETKF